MVERWTTSSHWDETDGIRQFISYINDDDFTFDASLKVFGDFGGEVKAQYAETIAATLNAVPELRRLILELYSWVAHARAKNPMLIKDRDFQKLVKRVADVMPALQEFPPQNEPRQDAEQLEFTFHFNWTPEEIEARRARTAHLRQRGRGQSFTLDDCLLSIDDKVRAHLHRACLPFQQPLVWD